MNPISSSVGATHDATNDSASNGVVRPGGAGLLAGRTVSRVGYGARQLERLRGDRSTAVALLRRAVELGVDHVDTAQFYGDGFVNDLLREAFRPQDGVCVVSKVGADPDPGGPFPMRAAQRPEQLRVSVQDNLTALGTEQLPVVNLRRLDGTSRMKPQGDQVVDLDDQLAVMTAMRDEGLIGAFGLSSVTLDGLRRALPAGIACVQNPYSLVSREDEDMLALCRAEQIAWVPFAPLGGVVPGARKVTDEPAVQQAGQALGCTPSQVGLAWLLHHASNTLLISGTADLEHLQANVAVGDIRLDAATLAALNALSVPTAQEHS